ncbi:nucleotidyltransferase family protein [Pseudoxanthomonas sp. UTMC 1351]|uniref:nucleotidyltransferase family protein n=1 Tax=Pseudoxanthomonas sp. UTMC 1351 TaxID=2695853 RepID=UPI0034CE5DDF
MQPSLKTLRTGLRVATETLAQELARPGNAMPAWNSLQWQLASAAAAAHGISPLLQRLSLWPDPDWNGFLASQRAHVEHRHRRVAALLEHIDEAAQATNVAAVALKGAALHSLGLYMPGDRPMADIDLLVDDADAEKVGDLLRSIGYVESFAQWKHRVFKPAAGHPTPGLGEHRDTPINIELHTRIQERLPVSCVDITERILPVDRRPGLNPYPSNGALMSHLLLHAAGNLCSRSLRLIHLNDIALLARRMTMRDWQVLWGEGAAGVPWWALPPLQLICRYYRDPFPKAVLARLRADCPTLLRLLFRRQNLTAASCSNLWLPALPGIEWSRSLQEAAAYLRNRLRPTEESRRERADMVRTQLWLQDQSWVTLPHGRRLLTRLTRPVPRMDTLYVVRAALDGYARTGA